MCVSAFYNTHGLLYSLRLHGGAQGASAAPKARPKSDTVNCYYGKQNDIIEGRHALIIHL